MDPSSVQQKKAFCPVWFQMSGMGTFLAPMHIYLLAHIVTTEILLRPEVSISTVISSSTK